MRFNPFRPNSPVGPGMFVGRYEELTTIAKCLFQTCNGNPAHFLIQGERGIGKSSLLIFAEAIAEGRARIDETPAFNFAVVQVDLGGCKTPHDIVRSIGRAFKSYLRDNEDARQRAKDVWDWISDWEIIGVRKHDDKQELDFIESTEDLIRNIARFTDDYSDYLNGLLILIDEADSPGVDGALGLILKYATEQLARKGCDCVAFGLAGVTGTVSTLRDSHESAPRLFQIITLEPLEGDEREEVVRIGLGIANKKNGEETRITDGALSYIAELSEGYPHFLQQFSYSAFEADDDLEITKGDVEKGAAEALKQLGDKFFSDMYHARINSEDYRRVLDAMSDYGDSWIARKDIKVASGVSDAQVNNALTALKGRGIILVDDGRRGYYRLPTRSFATWIKAIKESKAD